MPNPYPDDATSALYELLFCDRLELYTGSIPPPHAYPWNVLLADPPVEKALLQLLADHNMESRIRLLAAHILRQRSMDIPRKDLLGVIVEIGLEDGLDVLASYSDGTARYFNYTGKVLIWEAPNAESIPLTQNLFNASARIVSQIGPWNKPRKPFPPKGSLRISFLVSDGLYFGEGPVNVLFNDAMAGPALQAATALMQYVTQKK